MGTRFIAKVIQLGRITIPIEIRKLLGIREGDFVELEIKNVKKVLREAGRV